ncbi:MAG TPA: argininosuccinate lyase [Actinomycetes bacterium]|nr:argininosuccinate lyase [Actinomycetes bacterium]
MPADGLRPGPLEDARGSEPRHPEDSGGLEDAGDPEPSPPEDAGDRGPLWAGGFAAPPNPEMWAYTLSLPVDRRLWREDVAGSRAHLRGLVRAGVLDEGEGKLLLDGLATVAAELAGGTFAWAPSDEDVHTAVERRLTELVGPVGGKLHTGRSRNDQVATDLHLWLKGAVASAVEAVSGLVDALVGTARAHPGVVLPGLTHLQPAQPVLWAFQLAAHGFALTRDVGRLQDAGRRLDYSPLGAGAVAGSSFPLDPTATAADLGFGAAFGNAMDATSDRDGVAELLAAAAIAMVHASRLAEDVALWAGRGWVRLPDAWATGSSMLPQKRNPDVAELARGRAGTVIGRLAGFLATCKGLPLAYARDLQEDKAVVFETVDTLVGSMGALAGLVSGLEPDAARMRAAAAEGEATAVDLAEALVRAGVPFREAHTAVATAVRVAAERDTRLADLPTGELAAIHPALAEADPAVLSVDGSLAAKATPGSTAPSRVGEQLVVLSVAAANARGWAGGFRPSLDLG